MSDYFVVSPFAVPSPTSETATAPKVALGLEVDAIDRSAPLAQGAAAGRFVYCRGSNLTAAGYFVNIVNGSAVLLASGNSASAYPVGVAAGNLSATNVYGWVMVQGRCDFARGTNTVPASGVHAYFGGTDGHVLSTPNNNRIFGIKGVPGQTNTAVSSAGSYIYDLNRPFAPGPMSATNAGGY
jgi:hypothetical protein